MCFRQFFSYWLTLPTETAAQTYTLDTGSTQRGRPRPSFLSYLAILPSRGATSLLLPPLGFSWSQAEVVGFSMLQWIHTQPTNQLNLSHLVSYLHFVIRGQDCWWRFIEGHLAVLPSLVGERRGGGEGRGGATLRYEPLCQRAWIIYFNLKHGFRDISL